MGWVLLTASVTPADQLCSAPVVFLWVSQVAGVLILQREGADSPPLSAVAIQEGWDGGREGASILPAVCQVSHTPAGPVPHIVVATTRLCQSGKGTIKAAETWDKSPYKVCAQLLPSLRSCWWHIHSGLQINLMFFFVSHVLTFYLVPVFQVFTLRNQTAFSR